MEPKITVLMSVYNGERYLQEAVESVLNQTFSDFEFLIIDDASTDNTPDILQSFRDPRIKIVINEINLGLTKSLNKGLRLSRGEYVARMDADDVSLPERFKNQVLLLDNNPGIAGTGTAIQVIDQRGNLLYENILPSEPCYRDFLQQNQLIHGSVMIRRITLEEYHGYDELFKKCQDYALWLQVSKKNKFYNITDILYKLRKHDESITVSGDESIFYHILAVKIAESSIPDELIREIHKSGIQILQQYLTRTEEIYYHNRMALFFRFHGDFSAAGREYRKIFRLEPWNLLNIMNIIRIHSGERIVDMTGLLQWRIKNYFNRLL